MKFIYCMSSLLLSGFAIACHTQGNASTSFSSAEVVITGPNSSIVAATDKVLAESQFVPERRLQLQDGAVLIIGHPADKAADAGSIQVKLKESGSDDTTVRVEMLSSLYQTPVETRAVIRKTLARIQSVLSK